MALSIKDPETDRLVRRYAQLHKTSYTGAIRLAVSNALRTEGEVVEETERERIAREFTQRVREVQAAFRAAPILDPRHPDDILYDADGLPKATDDYEPDHRA